jgi:hypothetical protein
MSLSNSCDKDFKNGTSNQFLLSPYQLLLLTESQFRQKLYGFCFV